MVLLVLFDSAGNRIFLFALADLLYHQRLAYAFKNALPAVQRGIRVLEHYLHLLPKRAQLLLIKLCHVHAVQQHLAAGGFVQAQYGAAYGGLSAA